MELVKGMMFFIKGAELSNLMSARATWHANRVEELQGNREVAVKALEEASKAAELAGSAGRSPVSRAKTRGSLEIYTASVGSVRRNYGEDMEDPVSAIDQAIEHHSGRAVALKFYAQHVLLDRTYELTASDIAQYELLGGEEEDV